MDGTCYRALVVDDELMVRTLTSRALTIEGFVCDVAEDGRQAQEMIDSRRYEVVVTDLRMPNRNGHALVSDLLARPDHPVVIVLTGIAEPKLTKDLIARGADGVEFKPVAFDYFAAKVKALVDLAAKGGRPSTESAPSESSSAGSRSGGPQSPTTPETAMISESEMQEVLQGGHLHPAAPATVERRTAERQPYPKTELLAPCGSGGLPNPSNFREVLCHEISATGISFFLPRPPAFQLAVITLGKSTDKVSMLIRVVHCTEQDDAGRQRYVVGGHFERRVAGRELRGGYPAAHPVQ